MREIIPFTKEIVFPNNIASITSISLEHEEKIYQGEVSGEFLVYGDYKSHNDTTEKELFKYRLPFSALIPDNIDYDSVKIDISNFTYDQIENDVLSINIEFLVEGSEVEKKTIDDIDFDSISDINTKKEPAISFDEELNRFLESYQKPLNNDFLEEKPENDTEEKTEIIDSNSTDEDSKTLFNESPETIEVLEIPKKEIILEEDRKKVTDVDFDTTIKDINLNDSQNTTTNFTDNNIIESENITIKPTINKENKVENNNLKIENDVNINNEINEININSPQTTTTEVNTDSKNETNIEVNNEVEENKTKEEYVTYHIHVMTNDDVLESVVKKYNGNIDVVKDINSISDIKPGSKIIIPEYQDE